MNNADVTMMMLQAALACPQWQQQCGHEDSPAPSTIMMVVWRFYDNRGWPALATMPKMVARCCGIRDGLVLAAMMTVARRWCCCNNNNGAPCCNNKDGYNADTMMTMTMAQLCCDNSAFTFDASLLSNLFGWSNGLNALPFCQY